MKTVYALSSGSYSDYSVELICETEELANHWRDYLNKTADRYGDPFEVEPFAMMEEGDTAYTVKQQVWYAAELMDIFGENNYAKSPRVIRHVDWPWEINNRGFYKNVGVVTRRAQVIEWENTGLKGKTHNVRAVALGEKAAVKACVDRTMQRRAEREGL